MKNSVPQNRFEYEEQVDRQLSTWFERNGLKILYGVIGLFFLSGMVFSGFFHHV